MYMRIPSRGILPAKNCATIKVLKTASLDTDTTHLKDPTSAMTAVKDI